MGLRPLAVSDAQAWHEVRRRNADWLRPWEATVPPGDNTAPRSFRALVRDLRRQAREHRALPFAVTVDGVFAGQVTVTNIVGGSARWAQIGYWVDRAVAGDAAAGELRARAGGHLDAPGGLRRQRRKACAVVERRHRAEDRFVFGAVGGEDPLGHEQAARIELAVALHNPQGLIPKRIAPAVPVVERRKRDVQQLRRFAESPLRAQ